MAADQLGAVFQMLHAANLHADRRIELERTAAGGDLRIAVNDADLLTQLVDKDGYALALGDRAGQLAHRLTHHAGMQTDEGIAHFAFDFGARCQRGNRVDNHDVDRARAYERLRNVQTLLTGVRLGDQQAVNVNAECLGVNRVERVLGIDKRSRAAQLLCLCNAVQRNRGLTGGFRSVDLNDSAARQTADAEREIQTDRAGRDVFDIHAGVFAQTHNRAFAELLFDLTERSGKCFLLISRRSDRFQLLFGSHDSISS